MKYGRCRAVIHTSDGRRIPTPWREHKTVEQLGPDEFPVIIRLVKVAERYAKRKGFEAYSIGAEYTTHHDRAN